MIDSYTILKFRRPNSTQKLAQDLRIVFPYIRAILAISLVSVELLNTLSCQGWTSEAWDMQVDWSKVAKRALMVYEGIQRMKTHSAFILQARCLVDSWTGRRSLS